MAKKQENPTISVNKKAFHDYEILEKIECGLVLLGCEVKSIRLNSITLRDSYARIFKNEAYLIGCHIPAYSMVSHVQPETVRDRKLLLHKKEIKRLQVRIDTKGLVLVPIKLYFSGQNVKLEIGLGIPKKMHDKRHSLKEKSIKKDIARGMKFRG